jgi:predicted nucleic acid-binding protein
MIESEKIFFDTSPFIYLIENNPEYCSTVANYLAELSLNDVLITTSVITISEFEVSPRKLNNFKPIEDFYRLIDQLNIEVFDITREIAEKSASLRANYPFLKGSDSIQLASGIIHSCKSFITNDFKLKKITEIKVLTLTDIKN